MTRTHIIAADGTRFAQLGRGRIIARRTIAAIFLIITAIFLSAAIIGLQRAAIADPTLREGDKINIPANCWASSTHEAETLIIRCD